MDGVGIPLEATNCHRGVLGIKASEGISEVPVLLKGMEGGGRGD